MKTLRMLFLVLIVPLAVDAQSPDSIDAITDVQVTHGTGEALDNLKRLGFTPLVENACVIPPSRGSASGDMANLNRGIDGDTVGVWVRYASLPVTSDRKVLVDVAVANWPFWITQCPAGFQPADGDARITVNAKNACSQNGLCVKYAPLKDTETSTIVTALKLTRTRDEKYLCGEGQCMGNTGLTNMNLAGVEVHGNCGNEDGSSPVWVYLCRNREPRVAAAKAFGSVTAEEKLQLLKTYAPRIYLAKDEKYFPSDVEWSFANMVRYQNKDGNYWLKTKEPLNPMSGLFLPYWTGYSDVRRAPVYAFWVDKTGSGDGSSYVDLVYFTYYPYNLGKLVGGIRWGNHVGDWEHLTVRLMWVQSDGRWALMPFKVNVPFHDSGKAFLWGQMPKTSTHPIVYAASGSHGLWPGAGTNPYKKIVGDVALTDETSQGKAWDTWNRMIAWDYQAQKPLTGEPWPAWMIKAYSYAGNGDPTRPEAGPIYRWGNEGQMCADELGFCRLENGPTGPPDKDVWRSDVFQ